MVHVIPFKESHRMTQNGESYENLLEMVYVCEIVAIGIPLGKSDISHIFKIGTDIATISQSLISM